MDLHLALGLVLTVPLAACITTTADPTTTTAADVAQYDALQAELESHRTQFLPPGADELSGIGTHLFWLDFDTSSPALHGYDTTTSTRIDYGFSIGDVDDYNFRASESLIVNAEVAGDSVIMHAYALDAAQTEIAQLTLAAPGSGVKWWAYAPDHGDVYYVVTGNDTAVWKWTPATGVSTEQFTLESLGVHVGELWDFGVDAGVMVFIESGRAWSLDLATRHPIPLDNATESTAAGQNTDGVLLLTATGPCWYSYAGGNLRDLAAAIESAPYQLDATFAQIQDWSSSMAQYQHQIGYLGDGGLFTFDLDTSAITPLALNARDDSTVYASPVFLDDGSVFVQGLQSNEGDIGADGPVYRLATLP